MARQLRTHEIVCYDKNVPNADGTPLCTRCIFHMPCGRGSDRLGLSMSDIGSGYYRYGEHLSHSMRARLKPARPFTHSACTRFVRRGQGVPGAGVCAAAAALRDACAGGGPLAGNQIAIIQQPHSSLTVIQYESRASRAGGGPLPMSMSDIMSTY